MSERKTILLADDEHGVRKLVERALEHRYNVIVAANGAEAYSRALDHGEIHLLLTDVEMPRVNGIELAKRLKADMPNLSVVFMSRTHSHLLRADDLLVWKPFEIDLLLTTVQQALGE